MTTTTTNEQYEQYQEVQKNRSILVDLIQRQLGVLQKLSLTGKTEETLQRLQQQVSTENFKVLIVGEFKRGKSTFINALLGNKVLPAYARPCTAIINEIKWGASPRALLHYTQSEDGSVKLPREIPKDQIEQYVVIKDDTSEINGNPYEKVELFWPLELCQNGVEIIDSPGLNEHDTREKITLDYLSSVDAILFVLSCEALASKSELDVINNNLKSMGHEEIFFICNRFDLIRTEEREDLKRYGLSRLAPRTKRKDEGVFFISAIEALEGRLHGDNERVNKSGVLELEKELQEFLTKGRGRLKILQSARKLQLAISEAREIIGQRQAMLPTDFKTLEARYAAAHEPLSQLETKHRQLVEGASNFCTDMRERVRHKTLAFYKSLPSKVEGWLKNYEPKNSVKFLSLEGTKPQIERVVSEVLGYLFSQMEAELALWQREQLQPLISSFLEDFLRKLNEKLRDFIKEIDELRIQVSGSSVKANDISIKDKILPLERVLLASEELFVGGFDSEATWYKEMSKSLLPQIALSAAKVVVASFSPLKLLQIVAAHRFVQGFWKAKSSNEKIKEVVMQNYVKQLHDAQEGRVTEIVNAVVTKLAEIQNDVNEGIGKEIQSVHDLAKLIRVEKQKGQSNVEQKLRELASISQELNAINNEVDDLIAQVALR